MTGLKDKYDKMNNIKYLFIAMLLSTVVGFILINKEKGIPKFGSSAFGTERYWQDIIHEELSNNLEWESIGKEVRLDDGTRIDLLFPHQACEIDWATKWAEGIGQSFIMA